MSALISDLKLDVIALSETWHSGSDDVRLRLATPDNYAVADSARTTGRGGGVAVIFRKSLRCSRVPLPSYVTFESVCVRLTTASGPIVLLNVYRPGSARPSAAFYDEMASVLEQLVVFSCPVVVGGDINIHMHDADDPDARRLHELLESFEMTQHVNAATHNRGGTLDLVMTFAGCPLDEVSVDPAGIISDHALVVSHLSVAVGHAAVAERLGRGWRRVDRGQLRDALEGSALCQPVSDDADVDELFSTYDSVLRDVADRFAPQHAVRYRTGRLAPWFDTDCRTARRNCRRLERRYRRTQSSDDRRAWITAVRSRFRLYRVKKEAYWLDRLAQQGHSSPLNVAVTVDAVRPRPRCDWCHRSHCRRLRGVLRPQG